MSHDFEWELALAKFAVIAPLVCRQLNPAEYRAIRQEILAARHRFPGGRLKQVAERTLREWCQLYRQQQLAGLQRQGRKDKGVPRAVPPEVLARAQALKAELPDRSTRTICDLLAEPGQPPLAEATLNYHFRRAGLDRQAGAGKAFTRYEHARPNACWQSDLSDGLWLPDPTDPTRHRKCYLHAFIDDHSRLIPHAAFYWRESLPALEDCFRQAIAKYGLPEMVYWDNGSVFRAQQLRRLAARLRVQIVFATPYAPEGKGKIEKWFGGIKRRFFPEAQTAGLATLTELNQFFAAWLDSHYQRQVHSQTGQTPLERWEAGREQVRFATAKELADSFLWEEERLVRKTATVSLCGNHYPVDARLVGQRVILLFDPFDLVQVHLVHRGQRVGTASPQQLVARTYNQAQPRRPTPPPEPLASSRAFKDRLVSQAPPLPAGWQQLPLEFSGQLTVAEFMAHLQAGLGAARPLSPEEQAEAEAFWRRHAPLQATSVTRALAAAVAAKGNDRHLSHYLEAIRHAHWEV